jgi:hypothetical protein
MMVTKDDSPSDDPFGDPLSPFNRMGARGRSRFSRYGMPTPFERPQPSVTAVPIVETVKYSLGTANGDRIQISKHYELAPLREADRTALPLQMTGDGTWTFDKALGVPQELQMTLKVSVQRRGVPTTFPVSFEYKRQSDAGLAGVTTEPADLVVPSRSPESRPAIPARPGSSYAAPPARKFGSGPPSGPANEAHIAQIVTEFKSADNRTGRASLLLARLMSLPVSETQREEVASLLESLARSGEPGTRSAAVRLLKQWGGPANVPLLVSLLSDSDMSLRWPAIDALGFIGGADAAVGVAKCLTARRDFSMAMRALQEIGPEAEDALLPYLKTLGEQDCSRVCQVLGRIGTEKSIPALMDYAAGQSHGIAKIAAEQAVREIRMRRME